MKENCLVLGIETSCDETSAAVVADGKELLSNVISSQMELHRRLGVSFRRWPPGAMWSG